MCGLSGRRRGGVASVRGGGAAIRISVAIGWLLWVPAPALGRVVLRAGHVRSGDALLLLEQRWPLLSLLAPTPSRSRARRASRARAGSADIRPAPAAMCASSPRRLTALAFANGLSRVDRWWRCVGACQLLSRDASPHRLFATRSPGLPLLGKPSSAPALAGCRIDNGWLVAARDTRSVSSGRRLGGMDGSGNVS